MADLETLSYTDNAYEAAEGVDALVIMTEWNEFRSLDFGKLKTLMRCPVIIDARNVFDPAQVARAGFSYTAVGRRVSPAPVPASVA